ncbi:hypothetical protein P872_21595 [Rhodonellum psychrophilum GCM71 = DSM 17998]|uniref:Uncharacterized protein n=1 Tax=Rhodonellum psychrophilum GCM71 = DSM 17998 TaxID=1123057 RepID=U5BV53_9BACT|nr:hypothetical protein P872_21595 [Rhodonellum psychrophilum GCM71 = DSM 17998]
MVVEWASSKLDFKIQSQKPRKIIIAAWFSLFLTLNPIDALGFLNGLENASDQTIGRIRVATKVVKSKTVGI